MMEFVPVGGRLVVTRIDVEQKTSGGIVLARSERLDASMFYGEVLAVDPNDNLAKERGIKKGSIVEYAGIASFPTGPVPGIKDRTNDTAFISTGDVLAVCVDPVLSN